MFFYHFNILILKELFLKKYIIFIYFSIKNILPQSQTLSKII